MSSAVHCKADCTVKVFLTHLSKEKTHPVFKLFTHWSLLRALNVHRSSKKSSERSISESSASMTPWEYNIFKWLTWFSGMWKHIRNYVQFKKEQTCNPVIPKQWPRMVTVCFIVLFTPKLLIPILKINMHYLYYNQWNTIREVYYGTHHKCFRAEWHWSWMFHIITSEFRWHGWSLGWRVLDGIKVTKLIHIKHEHTQQITKNIHSFE